MNVHIFRGFWVDTTEKQAAKSQTNILQVVSFVEGLFSHFWTGCLFCASHLDFIRSELTAVASLLLLHPQSHLFCIKENKTSASTNIPVHPFGVYILLSQVPAEKNLSEVHSSL